MAAIPTINYTEILRQMHREYTGEFEDLFKISGNGAMVCRNEHVQRVNDFQAKFHMYFVENEFLLNHLALEIVGKGEIDKVNTNKEKLLRLYGVAFHLYLKSCRTLKRLPSEEYSEFLMFKFEDE